MKFLQSLGLIDLPEGLLFQIKIVLMEQTKNSSKKYHVSGLSIVCSPSLPTKNQTKSETGSGPGYKDMDTLLTKSAMRIKAMEELKNRCISDFGEQLQTKSGGLTGL